MSLTAQEQQELHEVLAGFGLSSNEQNVYLVLLQLGTSTITPLSKHAHLPATTIQSILPRLVEKGLLRVSTKKTRHVYEAKDPSVMREILEHRLQEISNAVPLLKKVASESRKLNRIRVYEGDQVREIFHEALQCKNKHIYEIVSANDLQKTLGEKMHFSRQRVREGIKLHSLRVEKHEIKRYNKEVHARELREAKFLPREFAFQSSMMVWDDAVAIFSSQPESQACVFTSRSVSEMMYQLFHMLWEVGRPMEHRVNVT